MPRTIKKDLFRIEYSDNSPYCFISDAARPELTEYIKSLGFMVRKIAPAKQLPAGICSHADLQVCRMGLNYETPSRFDLDDSAIQSKKFDDGATTHMESSSAVYIINPDRLGYKYPDYVLYNAVCTGRFMVCNEKYTAQELLAFSRSKGIDIINVKQGYAKCSCVIVDENSIITYDAGIAKECQKYDMNVLLVSPGHIELEGYNTGFIGGTSGRIGKHIIFNGNLEVHPDFASIKTFIEERSLRCKWFTEWPLTDIGSII